MRKFEADNRRRRTMRPARLNENYEELFFTNDAVLSRFDEFDNYPLPFLDPKGSRVKKGSGVNIEDYRNLLRLINEYDNEVFQDGIRLPIKAWSIAPIGMCRAGCNLTGDARFELNVTRSTINESPVLITRWVANYGHQIHTAIISRLTALFEQLQLGYRWKELILSQNTERTILFNHSVKNLLNWR
jgi:hypothetical protein